MSIIVAAVGDGMSELFGAVREFQTEKVILITYQGSDDTAKNTKTELGKFKIPVDVVDTDGDVWEETFRVMNGIKKANEGKDILVDVSTGNEVTKCAMAAAAFVNGTKAFSSMNGKISMLPILKFNYYKLITDRKMNILKTLFVDPDCCASMEELSKKCGMSLPLVSYHINGNPKSEGLKDMALVEVMEVKGKVEVQLSLLGKMVMRGYVD